MDRETEKTLESFCAVIGFALMLAAFAASVLVMKFGVDKFGPSMGVMILTWQQCLAVMLVVRLARPGWRPQSKGEAKPYEIAAEGLRRIVRVAVIFSILWSI